MPAAGSPVDAAASGAPQGRPGRTDGPPFQAATPAKLRLRGDWCFSALRFRPDRDAIARVQQALLSMAFFIPGGADGAYGPGATQAMKNFQAAAGLPRTGQLDAATLRQLDRLAMSGAALRELGAAKWEAPGAFGEAPRNARRRAPWLVR